MDRARSALRVCRPPWRTRLHFQAQARRRRPYRGAQIKMAPQAPRAPNLNLNLKSQTSDLNLPGPKSQSQISISDLRPQTSISLQVKPTQPF